MLIYTSPQTPAGTAPATWREGTISFGSSYIRTASSSENDSAYTESFSDIISQALNKSTVLAPRGSTIIENSNQTYHFESTHNYTPSTYTYSVPSNSTSPASTVTGTYNYTDVYDSPESWTHGASESYDDTSAQISYSNTTAFPTAYSGSFATHYPITHTGNGASVAITSFTAIAGYAGRTTATSYTDDNYNTQFTTVSLATTRATTTGTGQSTTLATTTWDNYRGVIQPTSRVIDATHTAEPVTYVRDSSTRSTTSTNISGSTYSGIATIDVTTAHAYAQKIDTIVLLRDDRAMSDYSAGQILWGFSATAMSVSTLGHFSDLFSSQAGPTLTLPAYAAFLESSIAVTAYTVSYNTGTITVSSGTTTTAVTRTLSSINSSLMGSAGATIPASMIKTVTATWSLGDIGTEIVTSSWDEGTATTSSSSIAFTHQEPQSGYSDGHLWTSGTIKAYWGETSSSFTTPKYFSGATTTAAASSRSTASEELLINSFTLAGTGTETTLSYLGLVKTSSFRVIETPILITSHVFDADYNSAVQQWTSSRASAFVHTGPPAATYGNAGTTEQHNNQISITHHTKTPKTPQIESHSPYSTLAELWFSAPPQGYAGFGGTFSTPDLVVHTAVTAGLVAGSAFAGQALDTHALPTASGYENITFFPVLPSLTFAQEGAVNASYLSHMSGVGTASLAVTWTSTTTSASTTVVTSRAATYSLAAVTPIIGDFHRSEALVANSAGEFSEIGGYFAGNNLLNHDYTVRVGYGHVQWMELSAGQSTAAAATTTASKGSVSFTVPGKNAVVLTAAPIFTANWTGINQVNSLISAYSYRPS